MVYFLYLFTGEYKMKFEEAARPRNLCSNCGKPMARSHKGTLCPACQDDILYPQVKDYILHNSVTEMEVAEHFDIPLQKVRRWISDGRIEYKGFRHDI